LWSSCLTEVCSSPTDKMRQINSYGKAGDAGANIPEIPARGLCDLLSFWLGQAKRGKTEFVLGNFLLFAKIISPHFFILTAGLEFVPSSSFRGYREPIAINVVTRFKSDNSFRAVNELACILCCLNDPIMIGVK